jgi:hypothetical protein
VINGNEMKRLHGQRALARPGAIYRYGTSDTSDVIVAKETLAPRVALRLGRSAASQGWARLCDSLEPAEHRPRSGPMGTLLAVIGWGGTGGRPAGRGWSAWLELGVALPGAAGEVALRASCCYWRMSGEKPGQCGPNRLNLLAGGVVS